jgi:SSS family solute:Na+ symporter
MDMNWTAIIVFVLLFGSVTVLGFVAAHWRRGYLDLLHEWGVAGRRLGPIVICLWFLTRGPSASLRCHTLSSYIHWCS